MKLNIEYKLNRKKELMRIPRKVKLRDDINCGIVESIDDVSYTQTPKVTILKPILVFDAESIIKNIDVIKNFDCFNNIIIFQTEYLKLFKR